jgi:predicted AAA+ superfamily ATPase
MKNNVIQFPFQHIDVPYSPALQKVVALVDDLSDEDTDELFSHLWAMGYGEVTSPPTN